MGARVSVDPLKKENSWRKSFLQIMLSEVLKICEKWCLLNDVKTSIQQQEIKYMVAHLSYKFLYKNYLQNLKYNVNSRYTLVGILSILILSVKNIGGGGVVFA